MCIFCEKSVPLVSGEYEGQHIFIRSRDILTATGYSITNIIDRDTTMTLNSRLQAQINYCPMCGRSLRRNG